MAEYIYKNVSLIKRGVAGLSTSHLPPVLGANLLFPICFGGQPPRVHLPPIPSPTYFRGKPPTSLAHPLYCVESRPRDHSKYFTPRQTCSFQHYNYNWIYLGSIQPRSNYCMNTIRSYVFTTVYGQVLICTATSTEATWIEQTSKWQQLD